MSSCTKSNASANSATCPHLPIAPLFSRHRCVAARSTTRNHRRDKYTTALEHRKPLIRETTKSPAAEPPPSGAPVCHRPGTCRGARPVANRRSTHFGKSSPLEKILRMAVRMDTDSRRFASGGGFTKWINHSMTISIRLRRCPSVVHFLLLQNSG